MATTATRCAAVSIMVINNEVLLDGQRIASGSESTTHPGSTEIFLDTEEPDWNLVQAVAAAIRLHQHQLKHPS